MRPRTAVFLLLLFLFPARALRAGDFEIMLPRPYEADTVLWVSPDGSDSAGGTESDPLATLAGAARAVAAARKAAPEKTVCVYFKEGIYPVTEPAILENLHSPAEKPILFRSAPGAEGKCVFTGKKAVSGWEQLASSEFWKNAPEEFKSRVRPEAVPQIWTAPYAPCETADYAPETMGKRQEFFAGGRAQTLARWPNEGFASSGKALGPTPLDHPDWAHDGTKEGIFEADPNQPRGWENEPGGVLFGYWYWDWSESYARYRSIEAQEGRQIITMPEPYNSYGYKDHLRYYGLNLLCELDAPEEYYIDRASKRIFWIPADGTDPAAAAAELTVYEKPWVLEIRNCGGILLAGLVFEGGFGGLASVSNSDDITFADMAGRDFSGTVTVSISGGSRCGAYHTQLENLAGGGFTLVGGDRKTLTDARHYLSQCAVRNLSRVYRTYTPAAHIVGCGIKVEHCEFSEGASSAMRIDANETTVEYCRFTDLVRESDDQGGIDAWYNPTYRGNVIRYNWWENIVGGTLCGAAAVRFDDMISGWLVYGNVFVRCGGVNFGAVQIHGGKENRIENNLFYDCRAAVSFSRWGERYTGAFLDPDSRHYSDIRAMCYEGVDINSDIWRSRYPTLSRIAEDADVNTVVSNVVVNCRDFLLNPGEIQQTENNTVETLEGADLAELLEPVTLARYGLKPIPAARMGITAPPYLGR